MAFIYDPNKDPNEEQNQNTLATGQAGLVSAGSGGQQQGAQAGPTNAPTRSGSWSNLMSYINANQGNDADIGNKIQGGADAQAKQAEEAQNQYQKAANSAIASGSVKDDGVVTQLRSDPTQVDKDKFSRQYNATYGGPQSADQINEYAQAYNQAQNVQNTAKLATGDESDRKQLLDKTFSRPNYTAGEKNLDSFILGGGQQGNQKLQEIGQQYGNYGQKFQGLVDSLNGNINQAKQDTEATRLATRGAADETKTRFEKSLADAQKIADEKNAALQAQYQQAASGNKDLLRSIGYDDNLQNFLGNRGFDFSRAAQAQGDYGVGDVANQNDIKGYNALMGLLGADPTINTSAHGGGKVAAKQDILDAARNYQTMDQTLKGRMGALDSQSLSKDALVNAALHDFGNSGISSNLANQINDLGGIRNIVGSPTNLYGMINSGGSAGYGDVVQGDEASKLNSYASLLGLAAPNLNKTYGKSGWNEDALKAAINQKYESNAADQKRIEAQKAFEAEQRGKEAENQARIQKAAKLMSGNDLKTPGRYASQKEKDLYYAQQLARLGG